MHDGGRRFACKCLNVNIYEQPAPNPQTPSGWPTDPNWNVLYVGSDGVTITHPQVTSRLKSRATAPADPSRSLRCVSLMCLICQVSVYRVYQTLSSDAEKDVSAVAPEGWVEEEPLLSPTGWIEVNEDCLTGDAINRAQSDTDYSSLFAVVLPSPATLPPSPKAAIERLTPVTTPSPQPPKQFLPERSSLFPPPPFSPSHPVFIHLSSLASSQSDQLRADAEASISQFVCSKVAELEQAESGLKLQVQCMWQTYLMGVEQVRQASGVPTAKPKSSKDASSRNENGPSVAIRDFTPAATPPTRPISSSATRRVSNLSQSLATSTFHHPRAQSTDNGIKQEDGSSQTSITTASSRTLVAGPHTIGDGVLRFPRNTNDTINTAASYRYFMNLEEEMARKKREQDAKAKKEKALHPETSVSEKAAAAHSRDKAATDQKAAGEEGKTKADESRGQEKGKRKERKVTFDVQLEVVPVHTDINVTSQAEGARQRDDSSSDMVFVWEEEDNEMSSTLEPRSILPLIEQPPPSRPNRSRSTRTNRLVGGLPASFAALRPTSLPLPSHLRPLRSHQGVDASSSQAAMFSPPPRASNSSKPKTLIPPLEGPSRDVDATEPVNVDDVSSHREDKGAFARRLEERKVDALAEEEEEATFNGVRNGNDLFVGSMPIAIQQLRPQKQPLSLASYRPAAAITTTQQSETVAPSSQPDSAAAARRASYAERDRTRSLDPGPLDFETEIGDDAGQNGTGASNGGEEGSRARKHALEILKARSQLPDEGMWRSLAS